MFKFICSLVLLSLAVLGFNEFQRGQIFKRAGARCEICSRSWNQGFYLECHHIIPLGDGGRNSVDNGQLLCINDHARAHENIAAKRVKEGDLASAKRNSYSARVIKSRNPRRRGF